MNAELCDGMTHEHVCPDQQKGKNHTFKPLGKGGGVYVSWLDAREDPRKIASLVIGKRKKLKCPKCGRKLTPQVNMCDDGCCFWLILPPHKPKEWWKKKKKGNSQ
jgi:hypothetical protein